MSERIAMGDGTADYESLFDASRRGAKRLIAADFSGAATEAGSVISASLFGALAASDALPFDRAQFEAVVKAGGKGVEASLRAFGAGFDAARLAMVDEPAVSLGSSPSAVPVTLGPTCSRAAGLDNRTNQRDERRYEQVLSDPRGLVGPSLAEQADRVAREFAAPARSMLLYGCERTAAFQDRQYCDLYLDRVARIAPYDPDPEGDAELTTEAARSVGLWMAYQDTFQVAQQKIRKARLARVRHEANAGGHLIDVHEYLHPQSAEVIDSLPAWLGKRVERWGWLRRWIDRRTADGLVIDTTSIRGFTMLWVMARMRPRRRKTLRFAREQEAIDQWLDFATDVAGRHPELALSIIKCQQVIKGYGETHRRTSQNFELLMVEAKRLLDSDGAAARLTELHQAALADEDGAILRRQIGT